jgi:ABC-2 type transport system ATP-binding protein/lipopolysaccharide transport system ATP-binding protein
MVGISFQNVDVEYPVYMLEAHHLRARLLHRLTFGRFGELEPVRVVVHALKNLTFALRPGDRLGVIGANGAGKTTLLQTVAGILHPTRGRRRVDGRISALYNIGLGFDREANGYENIRLRGLFMGLTPTEIEAITPEVEAFAELGDFMRLPIRTYSSGMQVRLAFAIATCADPEILVMDEWLGAGDDRFRERAHKRLSKLVEKSSILVLASHSEKLIRDNCDQAMLLHQGEVVEYAGIDDVYKAYNKIMAR